MKLTPTQILLFFCISILVLRVSDIKSLGLVLFLNNQMLQVVGIHIAQLKFSSFLPRISPLNNRKCCTPSPQVTFDSPIQLKIIVQTFFAKLQEKNRWFFDSSDIEQSGQSILWALEMLSLLASSSRVGSRSSKNLQPKN